MVLSGILNYFVEFNNALGNKIEKNRRAQAQFNSSLLWIM